MNKTLLKKAAMQSVALMLGVIMLSYAIKQYSAVTISTSYAQDKNAHSIPEADIGGNESGPEAEAGLSVMPEDMKVTEEAGLAFTGAMTDIRDDISDKLGEQFLIIRKPAGKSLQIQMEDIYILKQLKLTISGFTDEIPDSTFIARVHGDEVFVGEPKYVEIENRVLNADGTYSSSIIRDYGNDPVNSIYIENRYDRIGYNVHEIKLQLNHVYAHILYEDENCYYIDLRKPEEVYNRILVIDAGHGGKDPGAISKDEKIYEKEINLKILHELKELLDKDDVKVYYTRTKDETLYLRPRVTLANEVDCDFFISIHCNSSNYTSPNGTVILYYDHENENIKTKDLAAILSEEIAGTVSLENGGILQMKDDDIFILANAKVPAVIIETGYISNTEDLQYLLSKTGQQAMAKGIYNGILRAYEELMR